MKRRDILQSLACLTISPLVVKANNGEEQIADVAVLDGTRYVVFYDPDILDPMSVASSNNYLANAAFFPVHLKAGQSFDEAIRIYEMHDEEGC